MNFTKLKNVSFGDTQEKPQGKPMNLMKPLEVVIIDDVMSSHHEHIVMKTTTSHSYFNVISLTKPGLCWTNREEAIFNIIPFTGKSIILHFE